MGLKGSNPGACFCLEIGVMRQNMTPLSENGASDQDFARISFGL